MPRAARAYWKGFLRLSLVTIRVEVFNAIESQAEISFRQIHKPSGRRIQYQKTVAGVGEIDKADIVKGFEVEKDTYVTLDPEEIEALKLESKHTIDLVQFSDADDIDYRFFERPYFLSPADEMAGEGYVVIRDALRKTGKVGLGQVTIGGREWLIAVAPLEDGLVMEMLRYADELRKPEDYFDEVPTSEARERDGRPGGPAHRQEERAVQAREIREPLPDGAARARRRKAQGPQDHCQRRAAAQRRQRGRSHGGPEEEPRE